MFVDLPWELCSTSIRIPAASHLSHCMHLWCGAVTFIVLIGP